ncbi:N-acetylmuramoyl-L-alanine amidase family protein [Sphingobacterium bovistauri]|uniref:N-acetylmuramoyl-L-alanine amidase n=1 Tax=Sphingobacterium bovistauri TaxID=2781959 RepID=A0ABS7Z9Z9_9SPHI|nr:N-acetylmuramoyl-L-alanine amidase [Sphingobacterium bovistauri]MCA5005710.1 N-acetylmuramoyl-L-alanine amidase [Sphingobacterium bovistauri]
MSNLITFLFLLISLNLVSGQSLKDIRICLDSGHGGTSATDSFRIGLNGEREEWINLRVAKYLEKMLVSEGAVVKMTRDSDVFVDLHERGRIANEFGANIFVSIHHNATADRSVNYPVIYFHGSALENVSSVNFAHLLINEFHEHLYPNEKLYSIVSDYLIFPNRGAAVLRGTYGIPSVIGEASYFSNPSEELRLKDTLYNYKEAVAYFEAVKKFFNTNKYAIYPEKSLSKEIPQIVVNQEAGRMSKSALSWSSHLDYVDEIIKSRNVEKFAVARDYVWDIMKFFPDNYRVHEMYSNMLYILQELKETEAYEIVKKRYENYIYKIN